MRTTITDATENKYFIEVPPKKAVIEPA